MLVLDLRECNMWTIESQACSSVAVEIGIDMYANVPLVGGESRIEYSLLKYFQSGSILSRVTDRLGGLAEI